MHVERICSFLVAVSFLSGLAPGPAFAAKDDGWGKSLYRFAPSGSAQGQGAQTNEGSHAVEKQQPTLKELLKTESPESFVNLDDQTRGEVVSILGDELIGLLVRIDTALASKGGHVYQTYSDSEALVSQMNEEFGRIVSIAMVQAREPKGSVSPIRKRTEQELRGTNVGRQLGGTFAILVSVFTGVGAVDAFRAHHAGTGLTMVVCGIAGVCFGLRQMMKAQKSHDNLEANIEKKMSQIQATNASGFLKEVALYVNKHSPYTVATDLTKEGLPALSLSGDLCENLLRGNFIQKRIGRTQDSNTPTHLQLSEQADFEAEQIHLKQTQKRQ